MCPKIIKLLAILYSNMKAKVKWNGLFSSTFQILNGIKQGGVISPLLFTLYVDILIERVIGSQLGCYVGDKCSSIFLYADDIILLSPSRTALSRMLQICEQFGKEYGLSFNPDKCEVIKFGNWNSNLNLKLDDKIIKEVNSVKHLGHTIKNSRNICDVSDIITDIKVRTNVILSQFKHLSLKSKIQIFNSNCMSYYGGCLCSLESGCFNDLNVAWRVSVRRILGVDRRTHCNLLPYLMNRNPPSAEISMRMVNFFKKNINSCHEGIKFYFENCLINKTSTMFCNLKIISQCCNTNVESLLQMSQREIESYLCPNNIELKRKTDFIIELLLVKEGNLFINLDEFDYISLLYDLCTR